MKTHSYNTLQDVNKQLYFDFVLNYEIELTEQEKALMLLLCNLDYSLFKESRLGRKSKLAPAEMALIIVYAYMVGKESTREIEALTRRDMFLRALLGPVSTIDHTSIDRFILKNLEALEDLFYQVVKRIGSFGELGKETVFQDGTKIESRAGKYTFVWKKGLMKNIDKTIKRMVGYCNEAKELGLIRNDTIIDENNCSSYLFSIIESYNKSEILRDTEKVGRGHRLGKEEKLIRNIMQDMDKLREQENYLSLIGEGRMSLSKTDTDATFMRMKEDYIGNGQLKPAYNIQNAVDSGYIVGSTISSDRTDYFTCIPMMDKLNEKLDWNYSNYVADSGYDCNENFRYLKKNNIKAYIKPQDWEISKKRNYKKDIGKYQNMRYDEQSNCFICENEKKLYPNGKIQKKGKSEYSEYQCKRGCLSCPLRKECIKKAKVDYKRFSLNLEHWKYRKESYQLLQSKQGVEIRLNRSIQAEGSFAQIKANMGKRRFSCFGKERVFIEWLLFALAWNIKLFASKMEKDVIGTPMWYVPPEEATA